MRNRKPRQNRTPGGEEIELIYGAHAVLAALANPRRKVIELTVSENAAARFEEALAERKVTPVILPAAELSRLVPPDAVHQGILLKTAPLEEPDLADIREGTMIVVLDQVTDPHNFGAIMRSSVAFGASAIVTTVRHSPAGSGVLAKAASGAIEHIPLIRVTNLARALDALADRGFLRVGLDSEAEQTVDEVDAEGSVALVLGAEGKGLRRLTREYCDHMVRLDIPGPIKSLNVSNAAAVALYTLYWSRASQAE
jgi:23S rRNA (guanosine2251-2'-O)-methyltransferase